jgi:peptidoglycan/LPS O-acetylase OafA/YrhL
LLKEKRYFPNLNGLRCIAALLVIINHLEQAKEAYGIANIYHYPIIQHTGRLGVGLFFVLSGFLITYLLLEERGRFGNIDAKKFYLRRIFRIWPIYFLIVGLSLFIFPHWNIMYFPRANDVLNHHTAERLALLALVLPNYAFVLYELPYWCAQTWSIGVEEQFYYLWPWLIKYPKRKFAIFFIFIAVTFLALLGGIYLTGATDAKQQSMLLTFIGQFRIQTMILGGLCAYMVYKDQTRILNILYRKDLQIGVYTALLFMFVSGLHFTGFIEVYGLFFAYLILNASCNPNSILNFENRIMSYLGKISYGLYIYHVFVIVMVSNILVQILPGTSSFIFNFLYYTISFVLSVLVAFLSYNFLEKPILAFKDRKFGR